MYLERLTVVSLQSFIGIDRGGKFCLIKRFFKLFKLVDLVRSFALVSMNCLRFFRRG